MSIRLLALAASTRRPSLNQQLLAIAIAHARAGGATVTELDYAACEAPLLHGDHTGPLPSGAAHLSRALQAHDGWLLATPEYNWSIPGSLKNLIDWLSVDPAKPLKNRTALLLCASPSLRGGISGLQQTRVPLDALGMWVYPQLIGISNADTHMQDGTLTRAKDQQHLAHCVTDFLRSTNALRSR